MRFKTLSLSFALILCFLAAFVGPQPKAEAACPANFCLNQRLSCFTGCPCAEFACNPATCWSDCVCPIFCP